MLTPSRRAAIRSSTWREPHFYPSTSYSSRRSKPSSDPSTERPKDQAASPGGSKAQQLNDGRVGAQAHPTARPTSAPRYNFNTSMSWDAEPDPDHPRYRRVTARDLKNRSEPPTRVKMLVRDFIDDSLYNPNYGYFSKQAQIFSSNPARSSGPTPSSRDEPSAYPPAFRTAPSPSNAPRPPTNPALPTQVGFPITTFPNLTAFQEHVAEAYEREYSVDEVARQTDRGSGSGSRSLVAVTKTQNGSVASEDGAEEFAAPEAGTLGKTKHIGGPVVPGGLGRQVWHTPTELFRPHYSRVIARALLADYKLHHYPHTPFNLYELGAGNGSLMIDIMTFLKDEHPEIFAMTRYTIVEISAQLAERQRARAREAGFLVEGDEVRAVEPGFGKAQGRGQYRGVRKSGTVEVINKDWFEWEGRAEKSCYLVALEVLDNFAHDMIRYDLRTMEPLQAVVCVDPHSDFSLLYEPISDPMIRRYLAYRRLLHKSSNASIFTSNSVAPPVNPLLLSSPLLRRLFASLPFAPNLSSPEFLPTKQMIFLESLRDKLPRHRLLLADFDVLPETVPGRNGPVVQTRYGGSMVPCETFLVKQGYFDIFFPTDFEMLRDIYASIMTSPSRAISKTFFSSATPPKSTREDDSADRQGIQGFRHRNVAVYPHSEFLQHFGTKKDMEATRTKDGGNVMLGMYKNAKFMF